jgi:3-phosphoshikimate 1-carboxyvinyltransferase
MNMRFEPANGLSGEVRAPADKSISHRAALLGAMASEPVRIEGYLHAADTNSTLDAVRALGALVEVHGEDLIVRGTGLRQACEPSGPIDVGNAGTLLRLLPGWLAAQEGCTFTLDGDESIRRRPVDRIVEPLSQMGAQLHAREGRLPPLEIRGTRLRAISYELDVASAQVKSCVLLAALAAEGATTVGEPARSRDHTERMLLRAGVAIHRNGLRVTVVNTDELLLDSVKVPGDPSSAAFLIAAGVLVPGSRLLIGDVGVNWTRTGFIRIVRRMRGIVLGDLEGEPDEVPLAIDELPLVALLGCFAEGETVVRGAQEMRVKESDRIAGVVDGLRGLGADIEATEDGFAVRGSGGLRGGRIDARGDHRMAMMGAVAGLASREGVEVVGMDAAAVSYPGFVDDLARLCS